MICDFVVFGECINCSKAYYQCVNNYNAKSRLNKEENIIPDEPFR